jgi:hypothetical protein
MLHLHFGKVEGEIRGLSTAFDIEFDESWIDNPTSKRLIKAIDKSDVIQGCVIKSPILGIMPPQWLSGTVKALMLLVYSKHTVENEYYCGEFFGDNALPYMLEIARTKDIYVSLNHNFKFPKDMTDDIFVENDQKVYHGYKGYTTAYTNWICGEYGYDDWDEEDEDNEEIGDLEIHDEDTDIKDNN